MFEDDEGMITEQRPDNWSHPILMCDPLSITYDFVRRESVLRNPPASCPDMSGCIRVFDSIDSEAPAMKEIGSTSSITARQTAKAIGEPGGHRPIGDPCRPSGFAAQRGKNFIRSVRPFPIALRTTHNGDVRPSGTKSAWKDKVRDYPPLA